MRPKSGSDFGSHEQMRQAVRAGVDGLLGILQRGDMHDGQLASPVRGRDRGSQSFLAKRRPVSAVSRGIVQNQLDVIGSLRDARVHECLRLRRIAQVGILMPYSVPWPPGAVIRVPAEYISARSVTRSGFLLLAHSAANVRR